MTKACDLCTIIITTQLYSLSGHIYTAILDFSREESMPIFEHTAASRVGGSDGILVARSY
jgi:hypothetical protein